MASIGRVRVGNPEEPVAATAVVLRFGVRLEYERRKTTDHRAPPVSEARREGAAGRARLVTGLGCWAAAALGRDAETAAALVIGPPSKEESGPPVTR
jgi:hypothetical protein